MAKWRIDPASNRLRRVSAVAAGTGLNGGDYDWDAPAVYRDSQHVDPASDVTWTGDHTFAGTADKRVAMSTPRRFTGPVSGNIAAGSFPVSSALADVEAEGGPGADDLDTLTVPLGTAADLMIYVRVKAGSTITFKDGTGNLQTGTGGDVVGVGGDVLVFLFDSTGTTATLVGGAAGGGGVGVASFNARTGAVVPVAADYGALQVTATAGAGQDFVIPGMTVAFAGAVPPAGWGIDPVLMAAVPLPPGTIWILKA